VVLSIQTAYINCIIISHPLHKKEKEITNERKNRKKILELEYFSDIKCQDLAQHYSVTTFFSSYHSKHVSMNNGRQLKA
jgi:hypothetical protein